MKVEEPKRGKDESQSGWSNAALVDQNDEDDKPEHKQTHEHQQSPTPRCIRDQVPFCRPVAMNDTAVTAGGTAVVTAILEHIIADTTLVTGVELDRTYSTA